MSWFDPFWNIDQQWLLYDVGGSTTGSGSLGLDMANWQDGFGNLFNAVRTDSYFDLFLDPNGRDIWLRFNAGAIPEPSRALFLLLGLLGISLRRRR